MSDVRARVEGGGSSPRSRVAAKPPGVVLAEFHAALDALSALDPAVLADGDTVVALSRAVAQLESVVARQSAAFASSGGWIADGAQNASAWITIAGKVARRTARRRVDHGSALRIMPLVADAFAAGAIGVDHIQLLVALRDRSRTIADAFRRDEAALVEWASTLVFHRFKRKVDEWAVQVDEEGENRRAERQVEGRRLYLSQSFENQWFGDLVLDPVGGEIVDTALRRITDDLFAEDWAEARNRLGFSPCATDLKRTPAQRRADALIEMAIRAQTAPADGRRPQPLFTALVGIDAFRRTIELANTNTVVPPAALAGWLDDALVERIVFDGPDRVMAVGRQREYRGALRRAIQVRDRRCAHPWCDRPVSECAIDHIVEYAAGGLTSEVNGRLYCNFHNELRNREREQKTAAVFN